MTDEQTRLLQEILAELKEDNKHLEKIENQTFGY
jgi:RNA polymerase-binding transcription factor DksA